ncbi:ergothioneine biosynthesis protein EgtB [Haliangium ochraceum]|uniref:Ergothioneine biosynthesis protein EgtB n=1 Tax=Haliangium ochraceum (strain DSM 14365 / JCM 11303 / SMP-2) TaxID=502025 RepID=D0LL97_HALO1|nr:ergothioneine biosynthesis protein EgtB [Haliangium ochraceum]ACY18593.1 protein of unknown function DUF323 [Haliangium ochraceum DSM 14365]
MSSVAFRDTTQSSEVAAPRSAGEVSDDRSEPGARFAALAARYAAVRARSAEISAPLAAEDQVIQTIPEVSPTKWHLAHTTWFFERFVLQELDGDYRVCDPRYDHLFNSYYYTVGEMFPRDKRGSLSRPTVAEIARYRHYVDEAMAALLEAAKDARLATETCANLAVRVRLGLEHERQHQELMLTDIKHVLFSNPLGPAYRQPAAARPAGAGESRAARFVEQPGGLREIGTDGGEFCFDNELPRHQVLVRPHAISDRLVTNGEFREFVAQGAYRDCSLWLADGWSRLRTQGLERPLYWHADGEREFTLAGWQPIDDAAPVSHVNVYEADAFARWAGARLPSEAEWELAAEGTAVAGNFYESGHLHPVPAASDEGEPVRQLFGEVWEWTASPYLPYPGFKPLAGSLGEYNGKFMCNQLVVRGGSCVTALDHIRASYRSFFYPHDCWQFLGFRLARDS